ncbi:MAG: Nudix family hydrolase [Methylotenera sp.]|nr:Nudix family hydrolase [Methylotenera sp.]
MNAVKPDVTHAAVGVILRENGLVLLGERPIGKAWAGYWEFPGGKIEAGETPENALKRELHEELGITVTTLYPWLTRSFDYAAKYDTEGQLEAPAKTVKLHFFIVTEWQGEPLGMEKQVLSWQNPEKLTVTPMLPANTPILTALSLPAIYAITNLSELGEDLFFKRLKIALDNGLMMIQVREKQLSNDDLQLFVERLAEVSAPYEAKIFLNSSSLDESELDLSHLDINFTQALHVTGLHFTAQALMQLSQKPIGMLCGASCHNHQELAQAEALGLDYVLLSPVQATLSHTDAAPLGWDNFRDLIADYSLPVYALGGMQAPDIHTARLHGAHGIAMQRGIW